MFWKWFDFLKLVTKVQKQDSKNGYWLKYFPSQVTFLDLELNEKI